VRGNRGVYLSALFSLQHNHIDGRRPWSWSSTVITTGNAKRLPCSQKTPQDGIVSKAGANRSAGTLPAIPAPVMQTPGRRGGGGSTDDNDSDRSLLEPAPRLLPIDRITILCVLDWDLALSAWSGSRGTESTLDRLQFRRAVNRRSRKHMYAFAAKPS